MESYYYYGRLDVGTLQKEKGIDTMMLEELVRNLVDQRANEQDKKLEKALLRFKESSQKLIQELKNEIQSIRSTFKK